MYNRIFIEIALVFVFLFCFTSCSTLSNSKIDTDGNQYANSFIKDMEKPKLYKLDLDKLKDLETEPLNFIYLVLNNDGTLRVAQDNEEPDYVALDSDELKKIQKLLLEKNTYKSIASEQVELVNIEREKISNMIDLLKMQEQLLNYEIKLRKEAENILEKERKRAFIDRLIDRTTLILVVFGGVAIAAL